MMILIDRTKGTPTLGGVSNIVVRLYIFPSLIPHGLELPLVTAYWPLWDPPADVTAVTIQNYAAPNTAGTPSPWYRVTVWLGRKRVAVRRQE